MLTKLSATNDARIIAISGAEAQELSDALRSATAGVGDVPPPFYESVTIDFLAGTNRLGAIIVEDDLFWLNKETYKDKTGTVRRFCMRSK